MPPVVDRVASPAFLRTYTCILGHALSVQFEYQQFEVLVLMGPGQGVTPMAVRVILAWVLETRDPEGFHAMTCPAVASK